MLRLGFYVEAEDASASNCLVANSTVLAPAGFQTVKQRIAELGYPNIEVELFHREGSKNHCRLTLDFQRNLLYFCSLLYFVHVSCF